ncbi:MAG: NnrU family protein [Desulfobulbaceae bacterium]|nr:MAG: NnrU family protein [Desulfobulbaceae bacterium]
MILFIAGLILFLGIHCVSIVNHRWRDRMVEKIGEGPWKGLYSVIGLIGFVMIIAGFGDANAAGTLYDPPTWLRHISLILMIPVFPLLLAAYIPGKIKVVTKHPMLLSVKYWAFAHLLANGGIAEIMLFGFFLVWAVIDRISVNRRPARPIPGAPEGRFNDLIAIVGGLGLYILFLFYLHERLFGAPVM